MENNENKKSNVGLIIVIIIIILLILLAVWFFLLRDKGTTNGNTQDNTNTNSGTTSSNEKVEYNYFDGKLTQIVDEGGKPKQTEFVIDGIVLVGNRHSYDGIPADGEGVVEALVKKGYKKEGINSSFYLNEYIELYLDSKYSGEENNIRILVVPHKTIEEHEKDDLEVTASEKGFIMNYNAPDENNYKYVNEGYVSMDYPEGKYDMLFMYKDKIAYFITLDLTKEPTE